MKKEYLFSIVLLAAIAVSSPACKKFLDAKPDDAMLLPETLKPLIALMDNNQFMNQATRTGGWMSDDFYLTEGNWNAQNRNWMKDCYLWKEDLNLSEMDPYDDDWGVAYRLANFANTVLQHIEDIPRNEGNRSEWDNLKGMALFQRARCFYEVAVLWADVYDEGTAQHKHGIPLRTVSDFNIISTRATLQQTYDRIISDLNGATELLPAQPEHVMRPSKAAAFGLLSRVYLFMGDYPKAHAAADSALKINSALMDYNDLDTLSNYPIPPFNKEMVFYTQLSSTVSVMYVDSNLYNSYAVDDLRRKMFFMNGMGNVRLFKGQYSGRSLLFSGIATDELLLTRAECAIRIDDATNALQDLNRLLAMRWKKSAFVPFASVNKQVILERILEERRKELIFRGIRWADLRRLNKDGHNITLRRQLNGQTYTLPPNDPRWILPIPQDIIFLTGMPQNPR